MRDLSVNDKNEPRTFWTTAFVQAQDLAAADVALLGPVWRWIYGVNEEEVEYVKAEVDRLSDWQVVVRYAVDEKSTPGVSEDAFIILSATTLIEIQVPVTVNPRTKIV